MTAPTPIPWATPHFWGREQEYAHDALASSWISGGPFVQRFETALADELDAPHVVTVSNGTTAIHLAYLALGIGPGDEVIVPGFAFMAAANVAVHVGATPVFAEVDPTTWCLDVANVEKLISPRTRVIVPIHTYGNVCDMDALCAVASATGTPILEDAAEAFASTWNGKKAGAIGLMGTLSFHATKTITTGEGGAVVTADAELDERMRLFRSHGMGKRRYWHEVHGHNFRLTNMQAAIGCAQLESIDQIVSERNRVRSHYVSRLSAQSGIRLQEFSNHVSPVVWAMAVWLEEEAFPQGRDAVICQLETKSIETRPGFHAASEMSIYSSGPLPTCESVSRSVLVLPTFPTLTGDDIDRICDELLDLRA
jgi:perosamine synthetase